MSTGISRRMASPRWARSRGFTLIELMIAMLLGLLVIAAAGAIFVSNRQTYVATESLGRVQESARVAFELMARDLREAGGNPCDRRAAVANVIDPAVADWWANWDAGVLGYAAGASMPGLPSGTASGERIGSTDAIELKSAHVGVAVESHTASAATFQVDTGGPDPGLAAGDLAIVCDYTQASLFQVSGVSGSTVSHDVGGTSVNCTKGLGLPVTCDAGSGTIYIYPVNSTIAKVSATRWYVGSDGQGGRSLYRQTRRTSAGVAREEVVRGVVGMSLTYLVPGNTEYVAASGVAGTQWGEVTAVRVVLELQGDDRVGSNGEPITRELAYVASLRNRNI